MAFVRFNTPRAVVEKNGPEFCSSSGSLQHDDESISLDAVGLSTMVATKLG